MPIALAAAGPCSPWVDVHRAMLDEVPWMFQNVDGNAQLSASRIDLVLANHSAMGLVRAPSVLQSVRDGHSPVLFELCLDTPVVLHWQRPRPQLPLLLYRSSSELQQSADWEALMQRWLVEPSVRRALDPAVPSTGAALSAAMVAALQHLVALAGGWVSRPQARRAAYDSKALRLARRVLADLYGLARLLRQIMSHSPASWPRPVAQLPGGWPGMGWCCRRPQLQSCCLWWSRLLSCETACHQGLVPCPR